MSAIVLILLVVAVIAVALGSAALLSARALRRELTALRTDLAVGIRASAAVPAARTVPADEIRAAVADALADERERELAEARAFWAEQEARESADAPFFRGGAAAGDAGAEYEVLPFLPRQADWSGYDIDPVFPTPGAIPHPTGPEYVPSPVVADQEQTAERLADLADGRIPLADIRPGPLGTLDVYVFADGTTLCMTPGHRETAARLGDALDRGEIPVLLGGSAVAGAYALTFTYGDETIYVLADRVVASL